jgi:hypothetical protein
MHELKPIPPVCNQKGNNEGIREAINTAVK